MKVVNKHSYRGFGRYIGRPSLLGNPFVIGKDGDRNQVCNKFEEYARSTHAVLEAIRALKPDDTLICFCAPKACHGHRIEKLWKELHS